MSRLSPLRTATLLTMATVLSACGGGGGGGGSDSGSSSVSDDLVEVSDGASGRALFMGLPDLSLADLDADNAEAIVATALQAIAQAMQLGDEDSAIGPFDDFLTEASAFDFSAFAGVQFDDFLQRAAEGLADGITAIDCPVAGQFVLELNVPDEAEPDVAGVVLDLRSCDLGDDALLIGTLEMEVMGVLGALDAGLDALDSATMSVAANELAIYSGLGGFSADGTLTLAVAPFADGTAMTIMLDLDYASVDEAISWQDFQIDVSKAMATGAFSVEAAGMLSINQPDLVNGQFEVTTPSAISGFAGSYPEAGEIWIDGQGDSRITVSFTAGGDIRIRLFEGDEELPLDMISSWPDLQALVAQLGAED